MNTIQALLQLYSNQNEGFCFFRYPGEETIQFTGGKLNSTTKVGFQFVPFDADSKSFPSIIIEPSLQRSNKSALSLLNELELELKLLTTKDNYQVDLNINFAEQTSKEAYIDAYKDFQKAINEQVIGKAILSRVKQSHFSLDQLDAYYERLFEANQQAMCYLFYHPEVGLWTGASPELLIKQAGDYYFTNSLAGTKSNQSIEWGAKELDEQKIVTDFISNSLRGINASYQLSPLKTVKAGSVFHLKQEISFQLSKDEASSSVEDLLTILSELHPTPAIGGFPKAAALNLIKKVEKHQRAYYCGYLGELNANSTKLFVNLRCAQIGNESINLYLGGGITIGSKLEEEWMECEKKALSITSLLK